MKNKNVKDEKKEKKIGLTTKIFIALLLGAVFGIVLCDRTGIHPSDEDACCTACILFPCVRKYGNRRYEEARNSRCQNIGILPRNNSSCCNSCFISW